MNKDTETTRQDAEVAQFRFALIAPVIQGLFPDASATAYYKRVTASPLTLPDGSTVTYSYKMDLCQYFGQKKLKDYAAFFSSSSSFC